MALPKQTRQKRLNLYNSDRYYNFKVTTLADINNFVKVTRLNEKEIEAEMDELAEQAKLTLLARNKTHYMLFNEVYNNDTLINKLYRYGGKVSFYTNTPVPYYIVKHVGKRLNSQVIYGLQPTYPEEMLKNVELTFTACPTVVDVPVVLPDVNPYDILFSLHDLKASVDKVQFSFPMLHKSEMRDENYKYYHKVGEYYALKTKFKFEWFKIVQVSLSIWGMNIYLVADTEKEKVELTRLASDDKYHRVKKAGK
jgi:hypothetical protein